MIQRILQTGGRGGQIAGEDLYQTYQQNQPQPQP